MTITTISLPPPVIIQKFDKYLLLDMIERIKKRLEDKIIPLSKKKIRPQDVGKRRDFDRMIKEFYEEYERKEIEKEKYKRETEELAKKRPCIPTSGGTIRFKRMDTAKRLNE